MEQKLPPDWEAIANGYCIELARTVVERCFALHSKPKKELTDAEIMQAYNSGANGDANGSFKCGLRAVIAAHEAKQREPETVTFRAARRIGFHTVEVLRCDTVLPSEWEWLEPPQTFEVKV